MRENLIKNIANFILLYLFLGFVPVHAGWFSEIKVDEMTDEKKGFVRSKASFGGARMFVQCGKDNTYLAIVWEENLSIFDKYRNIMFRFDKEEADSLVFNLKNDQSYVSNYTDPDADMLIDLMKKHNKLMVRTENIMENSMTETFSLAGFTKAYLEACNWTERD